MRGAEIILECILEQGIDTVFGLPGGSILPVYDALTAYAPRLRHVLCAHEQGAAHMADGYARAGGRCGVALATGGPGATNLLTGMATAYMDSSPVLFITGNIESARIGSDSFQEVDIGAMALSVTKHTMLIRRTEELAPGLRFCFALARSGRPGPVLCDISLDAMRGEVDFSPLAAVPPPERPAPPSDDALRAAVQLVSEARRPVLLIGGGVQRSGAAAQVRALAERLGCPVVSTLMGLGCVPHEHSGFLGLVGLHGRKEANEALHQCDTLIALGTRFADRSFPDPALFCEGRRVLHIDIDRAEIHKNLRADVWLVGDIAVVLDALCPLWPSKMNTNWQFSTNNNEEESPGAALLADIQRVCPRVPLLTDVGRHQMWTARYGRFGYPGQLLSSGGTGTMGFGLGAAIGACLARNREPQLLITGDGSFLMNQQELVTLARLGLPVAVCVVNDAALGMVRWQQQRFYGENYSQSTLTGPDFVALAAAHGINACRADSPVALGTALRSWLNRPAPLLIDIPVDADAPL